MSTGFDWPAIKAALQREGGEVFLGTVFNLAPSGKYYTLFACGNLDVCPECRGSCYKPEKPGRAFRRKKWTAKLRKARNLARTRGQGWIDKHGDVLSAMNRRTMRDPCPHCGGLGSREAYLDQRFWEELEREAEEHGCYITNGEGDPCDIFVGSLDGEDDDDE